MERFINVAGAQLGPIARNKSRQQVVSRLLELMREAKARGSDIVVFPELALTTFFPRSWMEDDAEIDSFFEREMPSAASRPLFETAKSLGIGFYLGYAELVEQNGVAHHYNTAILVDKNAEIVGKYRKVHLPGHADNRPHYPFQHLEKRYFEPGDLGFPVWRAFGADVGMCICNDRRWPETYRVMAMQSVELILLGYNTPTHLPWIPVYDHLSDFHNHRACRPEPIRTALGWSASPKLATRRAASFWPAAASSRLRARSLPSRRPTATRCLRPSAISISAGTTRRPCSISPSTGGSSITN